MSILKIEPFAGLSGDMFLGALTSLADAYDEIVKLPELLHLEGEASVEVREMLKKGIACKHIKIIEKKIAAGKGHSHRHLKHIYEIIDQADISPKAKGIARGIFKILGMAESEVHGIPVEIVHFHEVGAIDSIMDIVGNAYLLDKLNVTYVFCTPVTTGFGFIKTEHGLLPVPCPATQKLLLGFPTQRGLIESEMTTPTGAAILRYLKPDFNIPILIEDTVAYGPGEKDFDIPNVLKISLCHKKMSEDEIIVMQTNIDDMSHEYLGIEFQDKLFKLGALDFYYQQVIMKKGRPGIVINILARKDKLNSLSEFILKNTSSIGIRYFGAERIELEREIKELNTSFGKVKVKESVFRDKSKRLKPESNDIFRIAEKEDKNPLNIANQISGEINKG